MCGIAGIVNLTARSVIDVSLLKKMNRRQAHRGPDDEGYFIEQGIGLAHRRLSIVDLSGGHQPLFNEDSTVCVVFNGEIYNFPDLVAELTQKGHVFATHSDTEVIVHAWEEWGKGCVSRFDGMFSFALWDANTRTCFIARDRMGKKPLYYTRTRYGQLLFGSELKTLLAHPDCDRQLRIELAEEFLMYGYVPDPFTAYAEVFKLEAGHTLTVNYSGNVEIDCYWDLTLNEPLSDDNLDSELIERFRQSVSARMMADVPLGAFLSGGVDSSAVVAMMAQLSPQPVKTCAIGFADKAYDESDYAERIAARYRTDHASLTIDGQDFSLVDKLIDIYDEPFADSSALPTYEVCRLARQHVTVALSGDGGDELFGGYRRYRMHLAEQRMRAVLPVSFRKAVFGPLGAVYPKADWAPKPLRAKTTFQSLAMTAVEAYAHTMSRLRADQRQQLFSESYRRALGGYGAESIMVKHAVNCPSDDPLKLIQYLDLKTWLVGDILTKVDRASMANSLEVRAPLLDHHLFEWGMSLPSALHISGSNGKACFKKALEPYVDRDILYRQKMGFSVPLATWFRGPLREKVSEQLMSPAMLDSGFFNRGVLARLVDDHASGRSDHGDALWCLLMLAQFLQRQ